MVQGGVSYVPGDWVHVSGFGKGIVREVRNGGRYLVEVKGRAMAVAGSLLDAVDGPRQDKASRRRTAPAANAGTREARASARSIDLHGLTVDEALEALDEFLNEALLADALEVHVIHGRSGGRLKTAVHRRLGVVAAVRTFRLDPRNAGVTIVML